LSLRCECTVAAIHHGGGGGGGSGRDLVIVRTLTAEPDTSTAPHRGESIKLLGATDYAPDLDGVNGAAERVHRVSQPALDGVDGVDADLDGVHGAAERVDRVSQLHRLGPPSGSDVRSQVTQWSNPVGQVAGDSTHGADDNGDHKNIGAGVAATAAAAAAAAVAAAAAAAPSAAASPSVAPTNRSPYYGMLLSRQTWAMAGEEGLMTSRIRIRRNLTTLILIPKPQELIPNSVTINLNRCSLSHVLKRCILNPDL